MYIFLCFFYNRENETNNPYLRNVFFFRNEEVVRKADHILSSWITKYDNCRFIFYKNQYTNKNSQQYDYIFQTYFTCEIENWWVKIDLFLEKLNKTETNFLFLLKLKFFKIYLINGYSGMILLRHIFFSLMGI